VRHTYRTLMILVLAWATAASACSSGSKCGVVPSADDVAVVTDASPETDEVGPAVPPAPPKFVLKQAIVADSAGADGEPRMLMPGSVAVSDDGNTVVVGSVGNNYVEGEKATLAVFHRSGHALAFELTDQHAAPLLANPDSGSDESDFVTTQALRVIPGEPKALFVAQCLHWDGAHAGGLLRSLEWNPDTGKIVSVQVHDIAWNGCSTADGCIAWSIGGMRVSRDGRFLYLSALRKPDSANEPSSQWWVFVMSLESGVPKLVQAVEPYLPLRHLALSRDDGYLLAMDLNETFVVLERDSASGLLGEPAYAEASPGAWYKGLTKSNLDTFFQGRWWGLEPAAGANDFVLAAELWVDDYTTVFLHVLGVALQASSAGAMLSVDVMPALGESVVGEVPADPAPDQMVGGFAAAPDGQAVAFSHWGGSQGQPDSDLLTLAWRVPGTPTIVPCQTWPLGYELAWRWGAVSGLYCDSIWGQERIAFSPDGQDLYTTCAYNAGKPEAGGHSAGGVLFHFQQVDSVEEGEQ